MTWIVTVRRMSIFFEKCSNNTSEEFTTFLRKNGISHITSALYHPSLKRVGRQSSAVLQAGHKEIRREDFYKLVGIIIHLGYRRIPEYCFAWSPSSLCFDPFVAQVMSRNHFEGLLTFLYIVDRVTEEKLREDEDKLAKVRPLIEHINEKCKEYYQPAAELSIDERLVRSKACFSFKQYICNKPTKWRFKLWCLCDAVTAYTSKFVVCRGKTGEIRTANGLVLADLQQL